MKKYVKFLLSLFGVALILIGCSAAESEPEVSSISINSMSVNDPETEPYVYIASFEEEPASIQLNFSVAGLTREDAKSWEEIYEIEEYEITDENIRLVFDDKELDFEKLSESVLKTEDGARYQYTEIIDSNK